MKKQKHKKHYEVAIDTVPLPEKPLERIDVVMGSISPVINNIIRDAMTVAIGTWPTPENKFKKHYEVAIDTVPLPEKPLERIDVVFRGITPVINEIIRDAMLVAVGTWPTPE